VAAAAAGNLLRLRSEELQDAFGYVATASPVAVEMYRTPRPLAWSKTSFAEQTKVGVLGAMLARRGYRGARHAVDSDHGFWWMVGSDRLQTDVLTSGLGEVWVTSEATLKAYPACRMTHTAIDALQELTRGGLRAEDVDLVSVRTFSDVVDGLADPRPATVIDATFSIHHVAAMTLLGIPPGLGWYTEERLRDPVVHAMADRIRLELDPTIERGFKEDRRYATVVEVATKDGRLLRAAAERPRTLIGDDAVAQKFLSLVEPVVGRARAASALTAVDDLAGWASVADLARLLVPA
jgi:2-methylcitrate dehydratase PrpD